MDRADDSVDRRSRILDAAVEVIAGSNVEQTRLADVADAAGVSLGLVQYYFRNRPGLLIATLRRAGERVTATWNSLASPGADPLMQLADYLRFCAGADPTTPSVSWSFWLEFWALADRDPKIQAQLEEIYRSFAGHLRAPIAEGVEQGLFAPHDGVDDVVDRLVAQIDGAAISMVVGRIDQPRMLTLLIDGLCTDLGVPDDVRARAHERATRRRGRRRTSAA
jgi:AcrR family transcriptional regulator